MKKYWNLLVVTLFITISFLPGLTANAEVVEEEKAEMTIQTTDTRALIAEVVATTSEKVAYELDDLIAEAGESEKITSTVYSFSADTGDGITHLARKALHQYLDDAEDLKDQLSRAQKVYVEDYLQNQVGNFQMALGESQSFASSQIKKALDAVDSFSPSTLESNLKTYVANVDWNKYEDLLFTSEAQAQEEVVEETTEESSEEEATEEEEENTEETSEEEGDKEEESDTEETSGDTEEDDDGEIESSQTENETSARRRVTTYVILIVLVLVVAGYFLLKEDKGKQEDLDGSDDDKDKKDLKSAAMDFLKDKEKEASKQSEHEKNKKSEDKSSKTDPED